MKIKPVKLSLKVLYYLSICNFLPAKSSLFNLPENDIFHISTFLRIKDGVRATQTCKFFYKTLNNAIVWREYILRIPGHEISEKNSKFDYRSHMVYLTRPRFNLIHLFDKSQNFSLVKDFEVFDNRENLGHEIKITYLKMTLDGNNIIGTAVINQENKAFIWTKREGLDFLGTLNRGQSSFVRAISNDGSTVVGKVKNGNQNHPGSAFIWTRGNGIKPIGLLEERQESCADAVSADGKTLVGFVNQNNIEKAFKWTESDGFKILDHTDEERPSYALTMSTDAEVIAGMVELNTDNEDGDYEAQAFKWTEKDGFRILKNLERGKYSSISFLNSDGSIALGIADQDEITKAVIWEAKNILYPVAMSDDTKVIIGIASDEPDDESKKLLVWFDRNNPISFDAIFQNGGLNYDKSMRSIYTLNSLTLSADGTQLIGNNMSGHSTWSWQAYLPRYDIFKKEGINLTR